MSAYTIVLSLHNLVRWIVIILAILVLIRSYSGWISRREWTDTDRKTGIFFSSALDVQLLLGLLLYFFLSPITTAALSNFGVSINNPEIRFFSLEHILYMFVAIILVHVGSVVSRRAATDAAKFRYAAIFYSLAVVIILIAIPWSRPLIRLG